jgi:hypothetical protein
MLPILEKENVHLQILATDQLYKGGMKGDMKMGE